MEWDICTHVSIVPVLNLNMCSKLSLRHALVCQSLTSWLKAHFSLNLLVTIVCKYVSGIEMCIRTNFYIMILLGSLVQYTSHMYLWSEITIKHNLSIINEDIWKATNLLFSNTQYVARVLITRLTMKQILKLVLYHNIKTLYHMCIKLYDVLSYTAHHYNC